MQRAICLAEWPAEELRQKPDDDLKQHAQKLLRPGESGRCSGSNLAAGFQRDRGEELH